MSEREKVLESLQPLFKQAKAEGLWFHCSYQDLWFSPEELEEYHREGRFLWGAVNWTLRDPRERLEALRRRSRAALDESAAFVKRIGA